MTFCSETVKIYACIAYVAEHIHTQIKRPALAENVKHECTAVIVSVVNAVFTAVGTEEE